MANTFYNFTEISQNKPMDTMKIAKYNPPKNISKFSCQDKKSAVKKGIILAVAGLLIGFVNGLFGAGGGMLAVPLLTIVAGLNMKRAHATAILVILPLCAVSSVVYLSKGISGGEIFAPTILGVVIGGVIGAYALKKCSNVFLQILFYGVMFLAGIKMIF